MNANRLRKVSTVNGELQAAVVQDILEQAGVPVSLRESQVGVYLDVMVPEEWVFDANNLLYPEQRSGEIFSGVAA